MEKNDGFIRIYKAIKKDMENWDGEQPIEEFVSEILQKRLLIDKEEADEKAKAILKGIVEYKEAEDYLDKNPGLLEKIINKLPAGLKNKLVNPLLENFESIKRSLEDGRKN